MNTSWKNDWGDIIILPWVWPTLFSHLHSFIIVIILIIIEFLPWTTYSKPSQGRLIELENRLKYACWVQINKYILCPTEWDKVLVDKTSKKKKNPVIIFGNLRVPTPDLANRLMSWIVGGDSDWSKLKPHSWCHTCLGTQHSLWSEFKKSLNRAVK